MIESPAKLNTNASARRGRWAVSPQRRMIRHAGQLVSGALVLLSIVGNMLAADGGWEYQPNRIRVLIAVDVPGGLEEELGAELPSYVQQRAAAATEPAWQLDANLASGALRAAIVDSLRDATELAVPAEFVSDRDKLTLLCVIWFPNGFTLRTREYDAYLQRWGNTLERECRQQSALVENAFSLICATFAPVAQLETQPADPKTVKLTPRGAALSPNAEGRLWCQTGDVFLPVVRRTTRNGELEKNGVAPVAWTYIEAVSGKDNSFAFQVLSGSRRPFGLRRQARVEQVAIALPTSNAPTTLHLHDKKNTQKALSGYEVFAESGSAEASTRLGVSDAAGEVEIPPTNKPIEMLQIKHGSQLLAQLPVVRGAVRRIDVPLPDDDARLTAEMRLASVREDLIDVVARRNILMSRARLKMEKKDYKAATELLRQLDELPGNPQFNLTLENEARLLRSEDPQIQKRIDRLFQATQMLTTKFLDLRPVNQIHDELREAQQKTPEKPKS